MAGRPSAYSRGCQLLAEWRGERAQSEVAEKWELDPATYSKFESGVRRPGGRWSAQIESLTDGAVPASSWWQEPARVRRTEARAS